jgi:hypothetical protein
MTLNTFNKRTGAGIMQAQNSINTPESPVQLFITFPHPILCSVPGCEELTDWGYARKRDGEREYLLRPYCWEHGLALRETLSHAGESQGMAGEQERQRESVARFVVSYFGGYGSATVLTPITIDEVTAWRPYTHEDFNSDEEYADYLKKRRVPELAWSVQYEREDGTCEDVQVVWSFDHFRFYLFRPDTAREE